MRQVTVVEVLGRAEQGRTQPYLCRCDDGGTYYLKGRSANRRGLVSELICASLAESLALPVAPWAIAVVPQEFIEESKLSKVAPDLADLGSGPVFASEVVRATEFSLSLTEKVPELTAQEIVVFDWWVQNEDRSLSEKGGNVNLLWRLGDPGGVVLIDHNLAFDPDFDRARFLSTHVFGAAFRQVAGDFVRRDTLAEKLVATLSQWTAICATIPKEWGYIDEEQTLASNIDSGALHETLSRCTQPGFWNEK